MIIVVMCAVGVRPFLCRLCPVRLARSCAGVGVAWVLSCVGVVFIACVVLVMWCLCVVWLFSVACLGGGSVCVVVVL